MQPAFKISGTIKSLKAIQIYSNTMVPKILQIQKIERNIGRNFSTKPVIFLADPISLPALILSIPNDDTFNHDPKEPHRTQKEDISFAFSELSPGELATVGDAVVTHIGIHTKVHGPQCSKRVQYTKCKPLARMLNSP